MHSCSAGNSPASRRPSRCPATRASGARRCRRSARRRRRRRRWHRALRDAEVVELPQDLDRDRALPRDDVRRRCRARRRAGPSIRLATRLQLGEQRVASDGVHARLQDSIFARLCRMDVLGHEDVDRNCELAGDRRDRRARDCRSKRRRFRAPRASRGSVSSLFAAPRNLNAPVSCRFSSFRKTRARVAALSAGEGCKGVSRT